MEKLILEIRKNSALGAVERIIRVLASIMGSLEANRRFISLVFDHLMLLSRDGGDPNRRVRRRTVRLRHMIAGMVIDGIQAGEIAGVDIRAAGELLYGFLEAAIFRLGVLKRRSITDLEQAMELAVRMMAKKQMKTSAVREKR
jgi:hypothetical protein